MSLQYSLLFYRISYSIVPSVLCHTMFGLLLPLGLKILNLIRDENKFCTVFSDYFQCCVLLAGRQLDCGHLVLVKAALDLLPEWLVKLIVITYAVYCVHTLALM